MFHHKNNNSLQLKFHCMHWMAFLSWVTTSPALEHTVQLKPHKQNQSLWVIANHAFMVLCTMLQGSELSTRMSLIYLPRLSDIVILQHGHWFFHTAIFNWRSGIAGYRSNSTAVMHNKKCGILVWVWELAALQRAIFSHGVHHGLKLFHYHSSNQQKITCKGVQITV